MIWRPKPKKLWASSRRTFLKSVGSLIASPAIAQFQGGFGTPGFSGVAGGGGGYVAKAVHFNGVDTWLNNDSLTATNNTFYSFVGWYKMSEAEFNLGDNIFVTDQMGAYAPGFLPGSSGPDSPFESTLYLANSSNRVRPKSTASFVSGVWNCIIVSIDTTNATTGKIYLGDTDVTADPSTWFHSGSFPFTNLSNGKQFCFGNDAGTNFMSGDFADWRIMPGISLLDGGGDIPLATLRLFIDENGKPVDPAVATAAFGEVGAILFSGDAMGFSNNQGTGGAFSLTGALTNASTSPSD